MLNLSLGSRIEIDGAEHIRTHEGARGHALFGPYDRVAPGRYFAEFTLSAAEDAPIEGDFVCAMLDVVADHGRRDIAYDFVFASQLAGGRARIVLPFELGEEAELEYRVHVAGSLPLVIDGAVKVEPLVDGGTAPNNRAPAVSSDLLTRDRGMLKRLYDQHVAIAAVDGVLVLTLHGISFNARCYDDVNFVDELFFKSAYNVLSQADACVIDVGLNIGLASLLFAAKPQVREVHAFEPFAETYKRALANLRLNPGLHAKIHTHNFGLADKDEDVTLMISDNHGDSGGMHIREDANGTPHSLSIRDAAATLRPIVASARERGLQVIAKIDCEGSEFPIFESLDRGGVFDDVAALMVEWHRVFEGRDQHELIRPLTRRGFVVFDLTPPEGNGFFYAVKAVA